MRVFLTIILVLAGIAAQADSLKIIDGIISRGNRAYDLGQRSRIRECADSAAMLLCNGGLHENDSIDLLASIYKIYGNYHYENATLDSAEVYYNMAQEIIDTHPDVSFKSLTKLLVLRDKAQLYYRTGDYPLAAELMAMADDEIEYHAPYEAGGDDWLITKLTYAICLARIKDFDKAIGIAETELANAPDKTSLSYAKAERMYAKILMLADVNRIGALKAYKSYFDKQKNYALTNFGQMDSRQRNDYWQTLRPFIADCYRLEDADAGFLYNVTLFSKGLLLQLTRLSGNDAASESALGTLCYKWGDIQKRLKPKQAAVEFIQYEKKGKQLMAALVLKPTGKPLFVSLTPPDEILSIAGDEMQSTDRSGKDRLYEDQKLHNLIWTEDLLNSIAGSKRVYFAPDGYMHRLAIEYMTPVENYELYRLSSTRRLMDKPTEMASDTPSLFIGGVNYDLDKTPGNEADNDASAYMNYTGKSFPRLSDASNEATSIYEARHNDADSLIVGSKASEFIFKEMASNYESILVSTHGDFCSSPPIPTDIKTSEEDATMSLNIIAFAGVNTYLHDIDFKPENHCDGLLSAKEISRLDLSECKLFAVSACQSALGHISADGVFGMQRGLKNAGVEVMLLSLWNVNSDATSLLMRYFYSHLSDGMSIRKAFALARNELMSAQDEGENLKVSYVFDPATMCSRPIRNTESRTFNSPQYMDAFIMIDALE